MCFVCAVYCVVVVVFARCAVCVCVCCMLLTVLMGCEQRVRVPWRSVWVSVVVGCCWLLVAWSVLVGCCWFFLVVVGCCSLLLVIVGLCWLLLAFVVVVVAGDVGCVVVPAHLLQNILDGKRVHCCEK